MSRTAQRAAAAGGTPLFSDRLTELLDAYVRGEAPNAGRFCGTCYTPLDLHRTECPACGSEVAARPPLDKIPPEVIRMFRQLRRRESMLVNGFAYLGLAIAVAVFIGVFYVIFNANAVIWWYIFDIVLLFVLARVLAGLLGGFVGDEVAFRYARRKLAEDWLAFEAQRREAPPE